MSLGLRLCASREGGTGGGGWVSALSLGSMAASGLGLVKVLVGAGWAISLLLCTNGLRKQSSALSLGSMAASGLGLVKFLVGAGWAISLLLCTNGLRKQSSRLVGPPFLAVKRFSRSRRVMVGREP